MQTGFSVLAFTGPLSPCNSLFSAMRESIETIVIGGGQAGLAMSYHLTRREQPHVVLERGRVAERWHSERWDSARFSVHQLDASSTRPCLFGGCAGRFHGASRCRTFHHGLCPEDRCSSALRGCGDVGAPDGSGTICRAGGAAHDGSGECGGCDRALSASVSSAMQRIVSPCDSSGHGEPLHPALRPSSWPRARGRIGRLRVSNRGGSSRLWTGGVLRRSPTSAMATPLQGPRRRLVDRRERHDRSDRRSHAAGVA